MDLRVLKIKSCKEEIRPLNKELHPHLPRSPMLLLFVAPPKSGKSCLLMNMLFNSNYYNKYDSKKDEFYFHTVYMVSPSQEFDKTTRECLKKAETELISISNPDDIKMIGHVLEDIMSSQKKLKDDGEELKHILVILDDCIGYFDESLSQICTKYRHWQINIWISSQQYRKIPLLIRNCSQGIVIFKLNNSKEIEKITDEWGEAYTTPANFESILRHATEKKYDFLFMDNENLKLYQNFDKLIMDAGK